MQPNTFEHFSLQSIHQSLLSHRLMYNGGFSNFEMPLIVRNSTYVAWPKFCVALVTSYDLLS